MNLKILFLLFIITVKANFAQNNNLFHKTSNEEIIQIGQWNSSGKITSLFVENNYVFLTNENKIQIIDISTISNPELKREFKLNSLFISEDITGNSEKIFVANNRTIFAFDISNPLNPDSISSIKLDAIVNDLLFENNFLYAIASYDFYVFDVSNNEIKTLGKFSLPESTLGLTRFDVEGTFAFIGSWAQGLYVIDIEDPQNPKLHGRFLENSNLIYAEEQFAYVADSEFLYLLDITDSVIPSNINSVNMFSNPNDLISDDVNLYVTTNNELLVYNKNELNLITTFSLNDIGKRIQINSGYIFIANNEQGLKILKLDSQTSIDISELTNYKFELEQNYPNPFNPVTNIKYTIPLNSVIPNEMKKLSDFSSQVHLTENDNVKISLIVYDLLGIEIKTLVNTKQKPGNYEVEFNGSGLPTGIYFYKFQAGNFVVTNKMILIK
ncbi:MAG: T9SS type A sorting domain-containing protein [Ignavibacteriae bacterium]|nr:T9SS type A sorting domain-containing protein [Ignavibacteriota bacterium]